VVLKNTSFSKSISMPFLDKLAPDDIDVNDISDVINHYPTPVVVI